MKKILFLLAIFIAAIAPAQPVATSTSILAKSMGLNWSAPIGTPIGLGGDVHSGLVPRWLVSSLFDGVRYDLSHKDYSTASIQKAASWYSSGWIIWIVGDADDVRALSAAGIKRAYIEAINEPNTYDGSIAGKPVYTPYTYLQALKAIFQSAHAAGYSVIGGNWSTWDNDPDRGWIIGAAADGLTLYCDWVGSHPYGVRTNHQLWDIISMQRTAWGGKPFLFTEFGIGPGSLLPLTSYDDPLVLAGPGSLQSRVLASITRQAMFEHVPFVWYDLAATQPDTALVTQDWQPTPLYRDVFANLRPGIPFPSPSISVGASPR